VAESDRAQVMLELGHAPMYYLPLADLKQAHFLRTGHRTFCPYKGIASYWTLQAGGKESANAVWTYENPYARMAGIKGYAGFYWGRMEAWLEDGVAVPGPREIPGRIDTSNQFKACFPALVKEWHPTKNAGIGPYEFAADSGVVVWWRDAAGREWQEAIRDRALKATTLRGDGDATPYG